MRCEEVNKVIYSLAEGVLDDETRAMVNDHISSCTECSGLLSFMEGALSVIESDRRREPDNDFTERTIARLMKERSKFRYAQYILKPLAVAAAIIFGVFTSFYIAGFATESSQERLADLPDEFYYANEIHLEPIESFFLTSYGNEKE